MKNKPLLNESTVRKFMKLANLGRVGQGFIAEAYGHEEEEDEEEEEEGVEEALDKKVTDVKGMKKEFPHKKGLKAKNVTGPKVHEAKEEEEDDEEEEEDEGMKENLAKLGGNKHNPFKGMKKQANKPLKEEEEAGAEMPMPEVPEVEPAEEPTEMDASSLADQIIGVLQGAGLVDVVDEEPEMGGEEDEDEEEEGEEEDEGMHDEEEDEGRMHGEEDEEEDEEEGLYEAKKNAKLAKLVAERVKARLAKEARIERLAETITKRIMVAAKKGN